MGLIYLFSPAAMFCILAWALACKFSQLNNQLKDLKDKNGDLCVFSVRHSLVCQAVLKLQQYFQNVLLALICYIFLGTIIIPILHIASFALETTNMQPYYFPMLLRNSLC